MAAVLFHAVFKFEEVAIEIVERFPFDFMATLAGRFPVGKAGATFIIGSAVLIDAAADDLAMGEVAGFQSRATEEFLCGGTPRAATL